MNQRKVIGMWIDPPSGWKYGFPKVKTCDMPMYDWLRGNGYPQSEFNEDNTLPYYREYPAYEDEVS